MDVNDELRNVWDYALVCPRCRQLYYERQKADVVRGLVPGESVEMWSRCRNCDTPSTAFRRATESDFTAQEMLPTIYVCVVER